jgi:SAM-dependent methyltransferase
VSFQDHFSDASSAYRDSRPTYPRALFEWLAGAAPAQRDAWDCACGNGQASVPLAEFFQHVTATDASRAQIEAAVAHPRVRYVVAPAEDSGLPDASQDLTTVAQAAHWLDAEAFAREVRRVLRPGGLLAYVTYGIHKVSPEVDRVMARYYVEIVGPYWPPERIHVDQHYSRLSFPFPKVPTPELEIVLEWDLAQVLAYVATWSATKEYVKAHAADPRALVSAELERAWGAPGTVRSVRWPLTIVAGYAGRSSGS